MKGENIMLNNGKLILLGIISFVAFFIFNNYILCGVGSLLSIGGDAFTLSYHMPSYTGIAFLASIVITCTTIVVNKINELLIEIRKNKKEEK